MQKIEKNITALSSRFLSPVLLLSGMHDGSYCYDLLTPGYSFTSIYSDNPKKEFEYYSLIYEKISKADDPQEKDDLISALSILLINRLEHRMKIDPMEDAASFSQAEKNNEWLSQLHSFLQLLSKESNEWLIKLRNLDLHSSQKNSHQSFKF